MFQVEFYEAADGKKPVEEFLNSLDNKMSAKLVSMMELLQEKGTELRMPYSEYLEDQIFQLRCKFGSDITRALYFFYAGERIIITNAFISRKKLRGVKSNWQRNDAVIGYSSTTKVTAGIEVVS